MMKHFFTRLLLAAGLLAATPAWGQVQIYRCVDAAGHPTYTNVSIATDKTTCKRLQIESDAPPAQARPVSRTRGPAANPTPVNFPKVSANEQKTRDNDRRAILDQELDAARQSLDAAKAKLSEQEKIRPANEPAPIRTKRLYPFQEEVANHERNIAEISKELANLK